MAKQVDVNIQQVIELRKQNMTCKQIAEKMNCSQPYIIKCLKDNNISTRNLSYYPPEVWQFLKENCKGKTYKELTNLVNEKFGLNITTDKIKNAMNRYKLQNGLDGSFKKGNIPFNKGKKMPQEVYEKCKATMFSKEDPSINNRTHKYLPVGTEKTDKNGYVQVRVSEPKSGWVGARFWRYKHHLIYEEHYGKIPKGHKVIFADGNNRNFDVNNLVLVSCSELAKMNKEKLYYKGNAEATKVGVLIAKIELKAKERENAKK